jgi:hypothetical protein
MNALAELPGRLLRGVFKIALGLALAVFLVSLLLASLVLVLGVSLWSLVTGRKPAPVVMFARMRERSQHMAQGVWRTGPAPGSTGRAADVVDVQAREIDDAPGGPRQP